MVRLRRTFHGHLLKKSPQMASLSNLSLALPAPSLLALFSFISVNYITQIALRILNHCAKTQPHRKESLEGQKDSCFALTSFILAVCNKTHFSVCLCSWKIRQLTHSVFYFWNEWSRKASNLSPVSEFIWLTVHLHRSFSAVKLCITKGSDRPSTGREKSWKYT